jgi:DNA-binding transcriptional MocR family regulator
LRGIEDGTVGRLEIAKRRDADRRQTTARKALSAWPIRAHPAAYHLWLDLPPPWRAEAFAAAAGRAGIVVTPAAAFAVQPAHAPDAVRLALGAASMKQLSAALAILAGLLREGPQATTLA